MDRRTLLKTGLLSLATAGIARGQDAAVPALLPPPLPSPPARPLLAHAGEQFAYSVGWRGFTGGVASVTVEEPKQGTLRLTADIENTSILRFIFRIRSRFQVLADPTGGGPHKTFLWQNENGSRRYREETFMPDRVVSLERTASGENSVAVPVVGRPMDPLSTLFWLRSQSLYKDRVLITPLFTNKRLFEARLRVLDQQDLSALGKSYRAWRVAASFYKEGQVIRGVSGTFWVSADDRRVPLRAVADTTYGAVTGTLTRIRGV